MAFHDSKKNNGYYSLFLKLFGHVYMFRGAVFPDTVYSTGLVIKNDRSYYQRQWYCITLILILKLFL